LFFNYYYLILILPLSSYSSKILEDEEFDLGVFPCLPHPYPTAYMLSAEPVPFSDSRSVRGETLSGEQVNVTEGVSTKCTYSQKERQRC